MKRLFTTFILMGLGALSLTAQSNEAITTQTVNNNEVTVTQAGATNKATAVTYGDENEATITSTGNLNTASITQGTASRTLKENVSSIEQLGDRNYAIISAGNMGNQWGGWKPSESTHSIEQVGSDNWASTDVSAKYSNTNIEQYGNFNTASQGRDGKAERRLSLNIEQTSSGATAAFSGGTGQTLGLASEGNYAKQLVRGDALGSASIIQNGNGNYAYQYTRVGNSTIEQSGDLNWASVNQKDSKRGEADIVQDGDANIADLRQSGEYAEATIGQYGSYNLLVGLNGLGTTAQSLDASKITLTQTGNYNTLMLSQANGATAIVTQTGNTNTATI